MTIITSERKIDSFQSSSEGNPAKWRQETLPWVKNRAHQHAQQRVINDFSINVATVNGSGSQSANSVLLKSIFGMGVPVSGKNLFPSNIAGLPTWYTIRASKDGYVARKRDCRGAGGAESRYGAGGRAGAARGRRGHLRGEPQPEAVSRRRGLLSRALRQDHRWPSAPRPSCASWSRTWSTWAWWRTTARHRSGRGGERPAQAVCQKAEGLRSELRRGEGGLRLCRRRI